MLRRHFPPALVFLLAVGLATQVSGCDSGGSKRASQYSSLVGTWRIQRVDVTGILRDTVRLEFLPEGDSGRAYRLLRPVREDPVVGRGRVDIPTVGVLRMTDGFARPLLWTFDFDRPNGSRTSVRFVLQERWNGDAQAFLNRIGLPGNARGIEMDLIRERD